MLSGDRPSLNSLYILVLVKKNRGQALPILSFSAMSVDQLICVALINLTSSFFG